MAKTTKAHFKQFYTDVRKWQETLGLHRWEIQCRHKDFENDWMASCTFDVEAYHAYIDLNVRWPIEPMGEELDRAAFHEVCHLLLGKLELMGQWRYVREEEFTPEVHVIIKTLENLIFE